MAALPLPYSHLPRPAPRGESRLPLTLFTDHPIQTPSQVPLPPFDPDPETRPTRKSWGTVKEWDFAAGEGWIYERGWQAIGRRLVHISVRDLAVRSPLLWLSVDEEVQFKLAQDSDGRAVALETCGRGYRFLQCEIPFQTFEVVCAPPPQILYDALFPPSPLLDHPLSFDSIRTLFDRDSSSSAIADAIEGVAAHGSSMRSELRFPFPRRKGGRFRGRGMWTMQNQQRDMDAWTSSSSREPPQDLRPSSFPPLSSPTHPNDGAAFDDDNRDDAESSIVFELGPQEAPFCLWASRSQLKEDQRAEDKLVELEDEEQQPANSLGLDLGTSTRSSSCDPSAGGSSSSSSYAGRTSSSSSTMTFPTPSSSSSSSSLLPALPSPPPGPRTRKASAAERMAAAHQGLPVPKRFERDEGGEWVPCFDVDGDEEVKGEAEKQVQQFEERAVELEAEESFPCLSPPGGGTRRMSLPAITAWGRPPTASEDAKDGGSVFVAFVQEEVEERQQQQQATRTALPAAPAEPPLPASPLLQSYTSSPAARMAQLHANSPSSSSEMESIKQDEEEDDSLDLADASAFPTITSPSSSSTSLPANSSSLAVPFWPKRPPPASRAQSTLKPPSSEPSLAVRDSTTLPPALEKRNSSSSSPGPPPKLDDPTSFPGLAGASSPPSRSSPLPRPSPPNLTSTTGALVLHSTSSWSSRLQQQATTRPHPPAVQPRRQQLLITAPPPGWAPALPGRASARLPVPPQPEALEEEEEEDDLPNSPPLQVKPPPVVPDLEDDTEQGFPSIPGGAKGKGKGKEAEQGSGRETTNKSPPAVSKWPFAQQRKPLPSPSSSLSTASTSFKPPTTAVSTPPPPPASTSSLPVVPPFTDSGWGSPPSTIKEEQKPVPVVSLRSPLPAPDSATSPKPAVAPSATPRLAPFTSSTTGISTSTSSTGAATSFSPPTLGSATRTTSTPSPSSSITRVNAVQPKKPVKEETQQQDQHVSASPPPMAASSSTSKSNTTRPLPTPPQLGGSWAAGSNALRQSLRSAPRSSAGPARQALSVPPSVSTQQSEIQPHSDEEEEEEEDEEDEDSPLAVLPAPSASTSTSTTTSAPPVPLPTSLPLSGSWATRSTAILQAPQPAPPVLSAPPPSAAPLIASAPIVTTSAATPSAPVAGATTSPPLIIVPAAVLPSSPPLAAAWTAISPTVRQSPSAPVARTVTTPPSRPQRSQARPAATPLQASARSSSSFASVDAARPAPSSTLATPQTRTPQQKTEDDTAGAWARRSTRRR